MPTKMSKTKQNNLKAVFSKTVFNALGCSVTKQPSKRSALLCRSKHHEPFTISEANVFIPSAIRDKILSQCPLKKVALTLT